MDKRELHELTEKLPAWDRYYHDRLITNWLEDASKELESHYQIKYVAGRPIRTILGLSNSSEEPGEPKKHNHLLDLCYEGCGWNGEPKPSSEKWCSHTRHESEHSKDWLMINGRGYDGKDFMFCPICGTPRPKPKELCEKPSDRITQIMAKRGLDGGLYSGYVPAILQYLDEYFEREGSK